MNMLFHNTRAMILACVALIMSSTLITPICAAEDIRIGGAGAGLGVIKNLAESFEKSHPGIEVRIMPSLGSSGGIKALLNGALDLAISGRMLKAEELDNGAVAQEFARTPFVFVTHKSVRKSDITSRELESIYNCQLLKWPDGSRIRLVLRPTGDTDTKIIKSFSREMELAVNALSTRSDMIMAITDQEAIEAVAKIPGALGGATLSQTETENNQLQILSLNGVKPTLAALSKGSYTLAKTLYMVSTAKSNHAASQFLQFIRSAKGRAIVAASGALPAAYDKGTK